MPTPARQAPAAPERSSATVENAGPAEEAASPDLAVGLGGSHDGGRSRTVAAMLARADAPTRIMLMRQLQRTHGNAYVQRLAGSLAAAPASGAVQRRPSGLVAPATAAGGAVQRQTDAASAPAAQEAVPAEAPAADEASLQRAPEAGVVQRAPIGAGVSVPIAYQHDIEINKGKYVKLKKVSIKGEGKVASMEASGTPTVNVGGTGSNDPKKDAMAVGLEQKKKAEGEIAEQVEKLTGGIVKTTEKKLLEGKLSNTGELQAKAAYEYGLEGELFKGAKVIFQPEFTVVGLVKKPSKPPEIKFLNAQPKVGVEFGPKDHWPIEGWKTGGKVTFAAEFEPDWPSLLLLAMETPIGWALASAAGLALLVGFSYFDGLRRATIRIKVAAQSKGIIQASNAYAAIIVGNAPAGSDTYASKATEQATADLKAILAPKNMTTDEYYQLMKLNSLDAPYYQNARSKYESQAMADYRQKVRDELKKWHDENFWQSFFSMNYLSDDMAMVDAVMDEASATGGSGSMR